MYLATRNLSDSTVFVSFKINIDDLVILFIIIININQKCVLQNFYINVVSKIGSSASLDNVDSPLPITLFYHCHSEFSDTSKPSVHKKCMFECGVRLSFLRLSS